MPLLDLGLVTRTILTLLEERLPLYPDWPAATAINANPAAPDGVTTGTHALSFYLYHVREDAHTKSQDWQTNEERPQRFKPMGVSLFYLLCPKSNAPMPRDRALADQLVMGLALKTLHDFAIIDDTTTVDTLGGPKLLMPATMRGKNNRLRISLQPKPSEEAPNFWQGGAQPTRLAAYYEVNATLLEPDEPRRRHGRVLVVGVHPFVRGRPYIENTRNEVSFTIPGESVPRTIQMSPAEVAYGDAFEVYGSDLKGDTTELVLSHRDFADVVPVDPAWNLTTNGSVLTATARATAGVQAVLPGVYGIFVVTTMRSRLPDGSQRDFETYSNQGTLAIAPAILLVTFLAGVGTIQVAGFEPHALGQPDLLLFAGTARLTRSAADPPPAGAFFTPAVPPADRDKIRFRLPTGTMAGTILSIRLAVRGAESAPRWEIAP